MLPEFSAGGEFVELLNAIAIPSASRCSKIRRPLEQGDGLA
jgi:hypothetical protein